jgi:large repetitive protein
MAVRGTVKAALALAGLLATSGTTAVAGAGPAFAWDYPSLQLLCSASANNGTLESTPQGSVCVLPFGQTTAPNNYSATIAVKREDLAGPVTFALTAGSLPPGLALSAPSAPGAVITGNPTQTGTSNFTIKATAQNLTATLAYQITITVQGPPDQLLCSPGLNGGFPEGSICVLPDALAGVPYQGHLPTAHQAGGTVSIIGGALPPGLTLPATFGPPGDTIGGTPARKDADNSFPYYYFTVQGSGDQGQPLYQIYLITVDPNRPLRVRGSTVLPGMVGGAYVANFFYSGGAAPYTWSVAAGQLPPGLALQTFDPADYPRDINDELTGTPTTAGTYQFTMQVSDYSGQQATRRITLIIDPPLRITSTTLPAGTVGVPYRQDFTAHGGTPPYHWFTFDNTNLPPGLTLDSAPPDTNNVLTGTPTKAGTFRFPMGVQDSQDNTVRATVTVTIGP